MRLREYEISVWNDYQVHEYEVYTQYDSINDIYSGLQETIQIRSGSELQEGFYYKPTAQWFEEEKIVVIGSNTMESKCRACNAEFKKAVNGEFSLTFILYSRYFDDVELEYVDNPFIKLLVNERKIKLKYKNKWYDFIIKNIDENSENKSYTYTATALFINELSKNGLELVFDIEQENSTGDIISLANEVVKDTDWKISGESELIRQTTVEPLYEIKLISSITGKNMFGEEEINIAAGQIIYGFYSSIINESAYFQFLYREDGQYIINTETGAINNSINWYIDNVSYLNGVPVFCNSVDNISLLYRGERYIRNTVTEYDKRVDKFVDVYEDKDGNKVLGYTTKEYLAPDIVLNLITNPNDFTDTSGWENEGTEYLFTDFFPSAKGLTGIDLIEKLKDAQLTMQVNLKKGDRLLNTGLYDNRKVFLEKGFAVGEKYVLSLKYRTENIDSLTELSPQIKGFIAFYDGMTEEGKYNIEKDEAGQEKHIFDFTETDDDIKFTDVILRTATAKYAVTYQDMLRKKLGFFIEANCEAEQEKYIFIDIQLFKFYENDGILIKPDSIPTGIIKTFYHYYYDILNKDVTSIEDIKFSYEDQMPSKEYTLKYDEECTKKRTIKISKSNRFNIIQELCELFECWADFVIEHNEDGSIKRDENHQPIKYIIFKKFIWKDNFAGFKYGINSKNIQRVVDSDQIVSKILVEENHNEHAIDGTCSISRAKDNPTGELFFYDFRYYYTQGLLNYSDLMNDLYMDNKGSPWLGYYTKMRKINKERSAINDELGTLGASMASLDASMQTYYLIYTEASEQLNNKKQEFSNYDVTKNISYESYEQKDGISEELRMLIDADPEVLGIVTSIESLRKKFETYEKAYNSYKESYEATKTRYDEIQKILEDIKERKEELNKKFYTKYSRFIQEGSWQGEDYLDDNLFYYDAAATLAQSANPQVSYNINVIDVSSLEEYQNYDFDTGDKTTIEDTEFFGWAIVDGARTPVQEEIIISEIVVVLDNESENIIKVQNYKTKFEDMFQRISAVTTSLQYQSGGFAQAAAIVTNTGEIKADTLQQSFANNSFVLSNAADQNVVWDESGITVTSPRMPNQIVRIINGGIYITSDGGTTWSAAITGQGLNAKYINSGQIDTTLVRIMNGVWPTYRWDGNGISAYSYTLDNNNTINSINYNKYVRFNQYGIFGATATEDWIPTSLQDVKDVADFALTWDGFLLRNKYGDGYLELSSTNDLIVHDGINNRIKIGNLGTLEEPVYGIRINNSEGDPVMETIDDGTLWLKDQLNISTSQDTTHVQIGHLENTKIVEIKTENGIEEIDTGLHEVINATDKFIVYEDGSVKATDGYFEGEINATAGRFEGEIIATSGKIGNLIIGEIEDSIQNIAKVKKLEIKCYPSNTLKFTPNVDITLTAELTGYDSLTEVTYSWYYSFDLNEWFNLNTPNSLTSSNTITFPSEDFTVGNSDFKDRLYLKVEVNGNIGITPISTLTAFEAILFVRDGTDGNDATIEGKVIQSSKTYYATTTDKTQPDLNDNSQWQETPITGSKYEYLWTRLELTYTDGTTDNFVTVSGIDGTDGTNGIGIVRDRTETLYRRSNTSDVPPNDDFPNGWTNTMPAIDPENPYLWTASVFWFDDGGYTSTYAVSGLDGTDGVDGRGIEKIETLYAIYDNATNPPDIEGENAAEWSPFYPEKTDEKPFVWILTKIEYTDGTIDVSYHVAGRDGIDGKDGTNGTDGAPGQAGKDGRGITETEIMYSKSISAIDPPEEGWQATCPELGSGEYLWTRTTLIYSDNSPDDVVYSVGGKRGEGIDKVDKKYALSTSNTEEPTNWEYNDYPVAADDQYVWCRTTISYTDGRDDTVTYTVSGRKGDKGDQGDQGEPGKDGIDGKDGIGVELSEVRYKWSNTNQSPPENPTEWSTDIGTPTDSTPYLWTATIIKYTDNTQTVSFTVSGKDGTNGADGINGQNGTDGKDGRGIVETEIMYNISDDPINAPTDEWKKNILEPTEQEPYLWTRTRLYYSEDKTDFTSSYSVSKLGLDGADGKPGNDGEDAWTVMIIALNGTIIKNQSGSTTLECRIYRGGVDISNSNDYDFTYAWTREGDSTILSTEYQYIVNGAAIESIAIYHCDVQVTQKTGGENGT